MSLKLCIQSFRNIIRLKTNVLTAPHKTLLLVQQKEKLLIPLRLCNTNSFVELENEKFQKYLEKINLKYLELKTYENLDRNTMDQLNNLNHIVSFYDKRKTILKHLDDLRIMEKSEIDKDMIELVKEDIKVNYAINNVLINI